MQSNPVTHKWAAEYEKFQDNRRWLMDCATDSYQTVNPESLVLSTKATDQHLKIYVIPLIRVIVTHKLDQLLSIRLFGEFGPSGIKAEILVGFKTSRNALVV